MVDLQVIEIRDILPVVSVNYIQGSSPQTLLVRGRDFNNAQEVYINETKSPDVVISGMTELLVQIPETQESAPIRSIVVVSGRLTRTDRSQVTFRIGDTAGTVDGFTRLIQTFLKTMLQRPGSDIFAKYSGGGLLSSVGRTMSNPNTSSLVADFSLSVSRTKQQILGLQARNPRLSMSERLLYARVLSAHYNPAELGLYGQLAIGNQLGRSSAVGLGL